MVSSVRFGHLPRIPGSCFLHKIQFTTDGLLPYAALILWVLYPLGYFSLIVQRFAVNRGSLFAPGVTPETIVHTLRGRGES